MQKSPRISLNAARVFEVAARNGSLKLAGEELSVTPSAVSHQIKSLEEALGVVLFERRNNAVLLSDAGQQFLEHVAPAIGTIERAAEALRRSASEVVLRVGVSLAVRWLIPRLEEFKKRYPQIRIRLETTHNLEVPLTPDVDLAISYSRELDSSQPGASQETKPGRLRRKTENERKIEDKRKTEDKLGMCLMRDISRPVLSPTLLAMSGYRTLEEIASIPVLSATEDDWDWRHWSRYAGSGAASRHTGPGDVFGAIRVADRFDTDDAAIHGAVAGIGMILMPPVMTAREIATGALVELPGVPAVQLGAFRLTMTPRPRPVVEKFRRWLLECARETGSNN